MGILRTINYTPHPVNKSVLQCSSVTEPKCRGVEPVLEPVLQPMLQLLVQIGVFAKSQLEPLS